MKYMHLMVAWAVGVAAAMAMAGCGSGQEGGAAAKGPAAATHPGKAAQEAPPRPYIGKLRPPVRVSLSDDPSLESGVSGELTLRIDSGVPLDSLDLQVEGDSGLVVTAVTRIARESGTPDREAASFAVGEVAEYRVYTTPSSGGTRFVSGIARFTVGGVPQAAPFRVPVGVSGVVTVPVSADGTARPVTTDAAGEVVDSMKAETTIR